MIVRDPECRHCTIKAEISLNLKILACLVVKVGQMYIEQSTCSVCFQKPFSLKLEGYFPAADVIGKPYARLIASAARLPLKTCAEYCRT